MEYLLKASAVLFIFYACYQLFLQKETFFQANRWFLLSGLIIACIIPLVVIPIYIEYTVTNTNNFTVNYNNFNNDVIVAEEPFDYFQLIIWTYFAGISFFFGKLIVDFLSLRKIFNSSEIHNLGSFKLLETNRNITPFSFFDRIVYNPNQFKKEELTHIINHEKVHTKQWHSIDTIISQIACVLFWFNPIAWLYKKALQQNLEFIADQNAQHVSLCEKSYQTVLLKTSLKNHQLAITNNFYTSLIKKRIVMLHKSKSRKTNQLKMVFVIPLLGLFMISFNTEDVYVEIDKILDQKTEQQHHETIAFTKDASDSYLSQIQKQLALKGITFTYKGIKRNSDNLITAIHVKFESKTDKTEYKVSGKEPIKQFIFERNEDVFIVRATIKGKDFIYDVIENQYDEPSKKSEVHVLKNSNRENSSHIDIQNKKNTDSLVYKTKTWTDKDGEKISINISKNGNTSIYNAQSEDPLFVLNGKVVKKSTFYNVKPDNIETINVLKDNSALEKYGDRGENGVILIRTKGAPLWVIKKGSNVETFIVGDFKDSITNTSDTKTKTNFNNNVTYQFTSENSNSQPLFILDGEIVNEEGFRNLNPNSIESLSVLKDKKATKAYGDKGKHGVIIIKTKYSNNLNGNNKPVIYEKVDDKYSIAITEISYTDDNGNLEMLEFVVSKNSSDSFLEKQKRELLKHNIEAKFSKVKRNKAGEITSIKISLDDNNGRKSSATWKDKYEAIPDIVMGKSKDDKLFVRAIGN
jgi:TonB-dependent SusC/RagA subfamily outer membrane receptor